jgi:hypothetical protein
MTKLTRTTIAIVALFAASVAFAQTDAQKSFDQIKTLTGSWEGTANGKPLDVSFSDLSNGSAVMSEIHGGGPEHHMVSMFHLDGADRLLITHYCSVGNQPRMLASASPDGKTFTFTYLDATNLANPDAGHMQKLVIAVLDNNHHTEDWTFLDHGKEMKQFFDLRRKM